MRGRQRERAPWEGELEAFVTAAGPGLLRTAYLLTGDRHHAEDVVQTALEKVARRWPSLSDHPLAYARRAVVTARVDAWRRRRVRPVEALAADWGDGTAVEPVDARGEDGVRAVELRAALLPALRALPVRQRTAVVLRYLEDLPEEEVAAVMGVTVGTVKSSAARGLARLRALLTEDAAAETPALAVAS